MKVHPLIYLLLYLSAFLFFSCDSNGERKEAQGYSSDSLVASVQPLLDSVSIHPNLDFFAEHLRSYQGFIQDFYQKNISPKAHEEMQKVVQYQNENYRLVYDFWQNTQARKKIRASQGEGAEEEILAYARKKARHFEELFRQVIQAEGKLTPKVNALKKEAVLHNLDYFPHKIEEIRERYFKRIF